MANIYWAPTMCLTLHIREAFMYIISFILPAALWDKYYSYVSFPVGNWD